MKKKRRVIIILLVCIILVVVIGVVFGRGDDLTKVYGESAKVRSIIESVTASGKIQPETEIKIQSEVSGQIIELPVREGDVVQKGQLLVRINPDIYTAALNRADAALSSARSSLSSAKARLAQAEAQLTVQELTYRRMKSLFEEKAVSQAELDNATGSYETAKAEVTAARESINSAEYAIQSAQASRNEASDNLRRTTIVAPMDGTVTALTKEIGETVLGNNMMSGDVIMKISALNSMEVNVEVNESDIVRVSVGDTAIVEVDAYRDESFKGIVTEIGNTALNTLSGAAISLDQVTNFSVKVRISRESYDHLCEGQTASYSPFRPGMSATVEIRTEYANNVLTVPVKAVTSREDTAYTSILDRYRKDDESSAPATKPDEPYIVVFVLDSVSNTADLRVVKTGVQDDQYIHVLEGVRDGEIVITGPYEQVARTLKPGEKVNRRNEEEEKLKAEEEEE